MFGFVRLWVGIFVRLFGCRRCLLIEKPYTASNPAERKPTVVDNRIQLAAQQLILNGCECRAESSHRD